MSFESHKAYLEDMQPLVVEMGRRAFMQGVKLSGNPFRYKVMLTAWETGFREELRKRTAGLDPAEVHKIRVASGVDGR